MRRINNPMRNRPGPKVAIVYPALLQMPQKRILEQTATECGFGTLKAFHEAFRRISGESPGALRKRAGGGYLTFSAAS